MKIHEYQSRRILSDYGIPVSAGDAAFDAKSAADLFSKFANPTCIAKVQVLMGGRGKAGGVQRVKTAEEARVFCDKFLGKLFSTTQSGGEAKQVRSVLVTEDIGIQHEFYLGVVIDRAQSRPVLLFSKEGGVEIEEVAAKNPSAIFKIHFLPEDLPKSSQIFQTIAAIFPDPAIGRQVADVAEKLARLFVEKDCSICEINPLVLSNDRGIMALDAKIVFDDTALFRHEDLKTLKDPDEEDARERQAREFGLNYVSMNGNVGCLVNGAGLAMATMDMIQLAGGQPANFLDVGGGATAEQVREGFKIILQDQRVKAILVNIFGGIMKCDVIAEGVIQASKEIQLQAPLIVRLEGTRVDEGRRLLKNSELKIHSCLTIQDAAELAVLKARESQGTHVHSH